ncbi:cupin domain-containing protein [Blastomonas fulva]|jgi:mannose-6-phosphate isomerase-like protein (cupin superfamily)|uniref:cupin domain-containing protein n=1 Tax=Blastomonas fulva TaxID=1550728 RepID=UPI003D29E757
MIPSFTKTTALLLAAMLAVAALLSGGPHVLAQEDKTKIVLIGSPQAGNGGIDGFFHGIRALEKMIVTSPDLRKATVVEAYPFGWPPEGIAADADAVVLYFDGTKANPLDDPERRADLAAFAARGGGLVTLYRAGTSGDPALRAMLASLTGATLLPTAGEVPAVVTAQAVADAGDVARGVTPFRYFGRAGSGVTLTEGAQAVLSGELLAAAALPEAHAAGQPAILAWQYLRPDGARSFSFVGGHDAHQLDEPALRRLLLNAIAWSADLSVPPQGIGTEADPHLVALLIDPGMRRPPFRVAAVTSRADNEVLDLDWGTIEWHVSGPLGNSDTLTTGRGVIAVGKANGRHFHPNSDEVLHVVSGRIRHTMNDVTVEMGPGDTVSIPRGVYHNAENIGEEPAVFFLAFDTAWREVVGEYARTVSKREKP